MTQAHSSPAVIKCFKFIIVRVVMEPVNTEIFYPFRMTSKPWAFFGFYDKEQISQLNSLPGLLQGTLSS